jgi:hypothetical protein
VFAFVRAPERHVRVSLPSEPLHKDENEN